MSAAIIDFDVRFPSSTVTVKELHEASGVSLPEILEVTHCEEFPVLADYEQAWEFAVEAGRAVLERTGVDPAAIGAVIYAGSGQWDSPIWSPAAKVADELGIERAHCFEVTNGCNGGATALQIAADKIALGRTGYVLVLMGDRLSDMVDRADPESKPLFNFGDAAAAILVGRTESGFRLVHTAMRTDPTWCDYYSGEYDEYRAVVRRRGRRKGLGDAYAQNFAALVDETLGAVGSSVDDVAFFLMNHSDRNVHNRVLETIGIPAERSVFNYHRLGHMGGADTFIALGDLVADGKLTPGDLVLLATSGRGFSWAISALEYRGGS